MTIAIVIGTHGWAAEQLLKTAEMLLGEQENVGWIDFVPGENAETLIEKYNAQLAKLDTSKGVLFLVDTWGGSPFNAASRIVVDKEHYEVVAGVNIPMLVETFMARDDNPSFDELVALAVETGREGVKALKAQPVEKPAPAPAAAPKAAAPAKPMGSAQTAWTGTLTARGRPSRSIIMPRGASIASWRRDRISSCFTRLSGLMICSQATRPSRKARLQKIAKQSSTKRAGVKFPTVAIDFFFT